jgi:hypothetical protein
VPSRNRRDLLAALIALSEDLSLLFRGPGAAPTGSGQHFPPDFPPDFPPGSNALSEAPPTAPRSGGRALPLLRQ